MFQIIFINLLNINQHFVEEMKTIFYNLQDKDVSEEQIKNLWIIAAIQIKGKRFPINR